MQVMNVKLINEILEGEVKVCCCINCGVALPLNKCDDYATLAYLIEDARNRNAQVFGR